MKSPQNLWYGPLFLTLLFLLWAVSGCTILSTVTGAATGVVDCTFWHVAASGPAGLVYLPIGPLEGAYRGAQLGWYADQMAFQGGEGPKIAGHLIPCTTNAAISMFGGRGLSWSMR